MPKYNKCLPNSCLFSIIPKHVQDQFVCPSATQCSDNPMTEPDESLQLTSYDSYLQDVDDHFEDFFSSEEFEKDSQVPMPSLPLPLTQLFSEAYKNLDDETSKELFLSMTLTQEDSRNIEKSTRDQRDNPLWHEQRLGRLIASSFHDILVRKSNYDSLIKQLLSKKDISHIPAIQWGVEHEDQAREAYTLKVTDQHEKFQCSQVGLVINTNYPHLGASPDGYVTCNCCGNGLIEIKCPFSVKDGEPHLLQDKKGSFMDKKGLIKSHKYYTQVQGQLEICERNYCDFIVWTPNGLYIERIYKDVKFIERLFQKLTKFFVEQFLPELMTRKLQMCKVYCVCQQEEYGKK